MFHHFSDDGSLSALGAISEADFEAVISRCKDAGARLLPADEWLSKALRSELRSEDICISFDDALISQWEIGMPVLERYGLTAFWFIYSSVFEGEASEFELFRVFYATEYAEFEDFSEAFFTFVPSYISDEEVGRYRMKFLESDYLAEFEFYSPIEREFRYFRDQCLGPEKFSALMNEMIDSHNVSRSDLATRLWLSNDHLLTLSNRGHLIGLHSYSHPTKFTAISESSQFREYSKNKCHIQRVTGVKPRSMAHPVNSYNDTTLTILRKLEIEVGFRSNCVQTSTDSLERPRIDCVDLVPSLMGRRSVG